MGTMISIPGGESFKLKVYGNATVRAGKGNDTVSITGQGKVIIGDGNDKIDILGPGTVKAGSGNDSITLHHGGDILIRSGGGSDTINLYGDGQIRHWGAGGHDTINLGSGNDTIIEQGHASVYGAFGAATIVGGGLQITHHGQETDLTVTGHGHETLVGSNHRTEFVGGAGFTHMTGGSANDTLIGGSGHETMKGGFGHDVFSFVASEHGGQHLITDFTHGQDKLYLEGHSLSYLQNHGAITHAGGNTFISLDGGQTTVELKGITSLSSSDITTHKP